MRSEDAARLLNHLTGAYEKSLDHKRESAYMHALGRMPPDVAAAAVELAIDNDDRFPTVAALNRHAKTAGWEPDRPVIHSPEERKMMREVRQRFVAALGVARSDEVVDLRYYSLILSFRWSVEHGRWQVVKRDLDQRPDPARAAAHHVENDLKQGRISAPEHQEVML